MQPQGSESREVPELAELPAALAPTVGLASLLPGNVAEDFSATAFRGDNEFGEIVIQGTASSPAHAQKSGSIDDESSSLSTVESDGSPGEAAAPQALPPSEFAADVVAPDLSTAPLEQSGMDNSEIGALSEHPHGGFLDQAHDQPVSAATDPDAQATSSAEAAPPGALSEAKGTLEKASSPDLKSADPDESIALNADSRLRAQAEERDSEKKASQKSEVVGVPDDKSASDDTPSRSSTVRQDVRAGQIYARKMRKGVAVFCSVLGLTTFLLSSVLTYQIALPSLQHILLKKLLISNDTTGFNLDNPISYGLYKSWYFWNITNEKLFTNGSGPPVLQQVGPYTMQQVVKINAVNFSGDEVFRSTTLYGIYAPERSCGACSLNDKVTVINEVFMGTISSQFNGDPIELLQTYVPGVILYTLQKIEDWHVARRRTQAVAKQLALQQFRLCNTVDVRRNRSIQRVDPTFTLAYVPEYCAWAMNSNLKYSPLIMTAAELDFLLSLLLADAPNPVGNVVKIINPRIAEFKRLYWFSLELSVGVYEYLNYLVRYLAQQYFVQSIVQKNGGLIITRTVGELLYGYYDPWLETIHGNRSADAWVTQIHSEQAVADRSRRFPEAKAYMGINRGTVDKGKLYWITQQGTILKNVPTALNARTVDWGRGSLTVEGPSGLFFGPSNVVRGKNVTMWLDVWMRHVTLQYIGVAYVHGLSANRYVLADSSLEACPSATTSSRKLQTEGPCLYPNTYRGLINMSRFQSAIFQTLPHFHRVDHSVVATLGTSSSAMQPSDAYDFTMDIEPSFGASVNFSFSMQKVFEVKRLTYLYDKLWVRKTKAFPTSTWIPHSYYRIETSANKSVCDVLSAGASVLSAVVFMMVNVVPFFSAGCIICGLQCLWRRKRFTMCYIVCIEGDADEAPPPELVTAVVMNPKDLQDVLEEERKTEQKQIGEFRWRRFNENLNQHVYTDEVVTKQHAEHRRATILAAAKEAAAKEAVAKEAADKEAADEASDKEAADEEAADKDAALKEAAATEMAPEAEDTEIPWDAPRSVSLLDLGIPIYHASDRPLKEDIVPPDDPGPDWARTASLIENEGPVVRTHHPGLAHPRDETPATSSREAEGSGSEPPRMEWSRTTSLIEASHSITKATFEWSRMTSLNRTASLIEAWGPGTQGGSQAWSRTLSTVETERPKLNVELPEWAMSASLVEAEDTRLRWLYPRTTRSEARPPPQGLAVMSSISEDAPDMEEVPAAMQEMETPDTEETAMPEMETPDTEETAMPEMEIPGQEDSGEGTSGQRRVTFKDE